MSNLMADCHGDGTKVYARLSDLHDGLQDTFTQHCVFLAMIRIRILETRIEELKGELARLEAVARVGY